MATHTGTSGADTLSETTFRGDTLVGRGGDDTYHAYAASWWDPGFPEYGIPGKTVYYRTDIVEEPNRGYDTVYYHIGIPNIAVSGSELPSIERIFLVNGLFGADWTFRLFLGDGAQNVVGSTLGETISGGGGNDTIAGARGSDSLIGGDGADTLLGGTGGDTLDGGAGLDRLVGGEANDVYHVTTGDTVRELAGEGKDTINASADYTLPAGVENLVLGSGNIDGAGNGGDNVIYAGTGSNALAGGAGLDTVSFKVGVAGRGVSASLATGLASGGSGIDTLSSFQNLEGTLYADTLQGNAAGNRIYGLSGNDTLHGGAGADTLFGGLGDDQYHLGTDDVANERSDEGTDQVFSAASHTLRANVEHLQLEGSADINGVGNSANNDLTGNGGNNALAGAGGNDTLEGGDGNDTLTGGAGYDRITGGAGADVFRFDSVADAWSGSIRDVILDFASGVDRITLAGIDADPGVAGDQAFDPADDLAYDPGSGILQADIAGGASFEFQIQLGLFLHPGTVLVADIIL